MGTKLAKSTYPSGTNAASFECFGPAATEDGNFQNVNIVDMGSFTQDGKNSNKYYHAAVVKDKSSGQWYCYFEWGRVGATNPQFQFIQCPTQASAQSELAKQCHSKNDKRGVWTTVAGHRTLTAKPGKDVYLVRSLATRSTGLPDAKTIKHTEDVPVKKKKVKSKKTVLVDNQTRSLLRDLIGGTITYTKGQMADSSLPTQSSIDMGRDFLTEAKKRLVVVGDNVDEQVADSELVEITEQLYRRIGKSLPTRGISASDWILSKNNILSWEQDLNAFESALDAGDWDDTEEVDDPYNGMPLTMEWIDPKTKLGKFLYYWWPRATANRHSYIGDMKIKNIWKVDRRGDEDLISGYINQIQKSKRSIDHRPMFQPDYRHDLNEDNNQKWNETNTALLFHGTRSVNVSGILRENLRLPKQLVGVVITGAMFGSGIYFADDWKKSAGYTSLRNSYWSRGAGGISRRGAFMFATEVCLGKPHLAPHSKGYVGPPKGTDCIFGAGAVYDSKKNSGVQNNEWITFERNSFQLKYLCEFEAA